LQYLKQRIRKLSLTLTLPLLAAGLSNSESARAFGPENHRLLSTAAVTYYKNNCDADQSLAWADAEVVGKGARGEDSIFRLTRVFNWHFFNPYKDLQASKRLVNPTPDRYLSGAEKQIRKGIRKSDSKLVSKAVGAYAHYIQDNANPAHISPIYHGPFKKDQFDEWPLPVYSIFDAGFCKDTDTAYTKLLAESSEQPQLNLLHKVFEGAFKQTARVYDQTFSATIDGQAITLQWRDFWDDCGGDDFCNYEDALLGNHFGKYRIPVVPEKKIEGSTCEAGAQCTVEIDFDQYHQFAQQQARTAALNTVVALLVVSDAYLQGSP